MTEIDDPREMIGWDSLTPQSQALLLGWYLHQTCEGGLPWWVAA